MRLVIRATCAGERKYFGSTVVSMMSDNVHAFAVLGDSVMFAVTHLPFDTIPQFFNRGDDGFKSAATGMIEQSLNVFQDE